MKKLPFIAWYNLIMGLANVACAANGVAEHRALQAAISAFIGGAATWAFVTAWQYTNGTPR